MSDADVVSIEADLPKRRPLVVVVLGALYLAQAGRYVVQSGVLGGAPEPSGDWFWALLSGAALLFPAAPLLIAGIGFLWFRRPLYYYVAMLMALLSLAMACVGGVVDVIEIVKTMVRDDAPTERLVALGDVILSALVVVMIAVLHLVILTEPRVTRWFR